jgi:hypothetical protein
MGHVRGEGDAWFEALPAHTTAKADISKALAALLTAACELAEAQQRAVGMLTLAVDEADDAPEPPEDTIEPEITASAPDALFSTDDDWVKATQRLIARKRLTDDDEA